MDWRFALGLCLLTACSKPLSARADTVTLAYSEPALARAALSDPAWPNAPMRDVCPFQAEAVDLQGRPCRRRAQRTPRDPQLIITGAEMPQYLEPVRRPSQRPGLFSPGAIEEFFPPQDWANGQMVPTAEKF